MNLQRKLQLRNKRIKWNLFIYAFILIVLISCNSNAIYFDIETQSLQSCNSKGIKRIYVEDESSTETYLISWTDTVSTAPDNIKLKNIQCGYNIYKGWKDEQINAYNFKLLPSKAYVIKRVQGDASSFKIKIWTDNSGNISKTSHSSCSSTGTNL